MPESLKLYLDQMFQMEVTQVLCQHGYDVIRASERGQERADDQQILNKVTKTAISKATSMSFPLVGNLSENPEGLRTSRNDKER